MPTADAAARDRAASNQIRTTLVIARQAQGLNLTQLADRVGCYANQINKWEQPDGPVPGIDWLARWAAALGYEIALLSKTTDTEESAVMADQTFQQIAAEKCLRCGHTGHLHRLDDAQNVGPGDPQAKFRCLGFDPALPGPPVRTCFCPDMVRSTPRAGAAL